MPAETKVTVKALKGIFLHSRKMNEMLRFYRAIGLAPVKQFTHDACFTFSSVHQGSTYGYLRGPPVRRQSLTPQARRGFVCG